MRTLCANCKGKGWVEVASPTGSAPPYDRCPKCRGRAWVDDGKPKERPTLATCLRDAADRRRDEPAHFSGLWNGDLMRVAKRTTPSDVIPLLGLIAAVVAVLAVPL